MIDNFMENLMGNLNEIIDFIVKYIPTFTFIFAVLSAGMWGIIRGARKSFILLIHAIVSFVICFILFLIFVNSKEFDKFLLSTINSIQGSENAVQDMLGVDASCDTIRECILDYIPRQMSFMDGLELIIRENGAYLSTLVDLIYRIVFGLILFIVYFILVFVFYIIYFIFYSERKYKKKVTKRYRENLSDKQYKKNRLLGGMIGVIRGCVAGIISLSFLGTLFFIVSGGTGSEKDPDIDFNEETINVAYTAYQSISSYGTTGIFKVLNSIKDSKNTPYYLFAADLIFQGKLEDVERDINTNVYFREEIATYVDFSKDTFKLLLKHGGDDLDLVLKGEYDGDPMDVIVDIMCKSEFQSEFTSLINDFDSKTYFVNLSLSLVDSIFRNFDSLEFSNGMPAEALEIINIAFKKNYYSEYIPYEKELKAKLDANIISPEQAKLQNLNVSDLVTKDDIVEILNMFFDIININNTASEDMNVSFEITKAVIQRIKNLSMFNSNSTKFNPVIKRLYAFVDEVYLQASDDNTTQLSLDSQNKKNKLYYIDEDYDSIDWMHEISMLLDVASDMFYIYDNVYEEDKDILDMLFSIFENDDISTVYDRISKTIYDSKIIAQVLSSNLVYQSLENVFIQIVPEYNMPTDISYANKYDSAGNLIQNGELYQFLTAVKHIFSNSENKEFFDLFDGDSDKSTKDLVHDVVNLLTTEENGTRLCDYMVNSRILQSVLSGFILTTIKVDGEALIYADDSILEHDEDGNAINIICKEELLTFFNLSVKFVDLASPLLEDSVNTDEMVNVLKNKELINVFDSKLIEGTVSNLLVNTLRDNETIILPNRLLNKEKMISTENENSDIKQLCLVIQECTIDIANIISSGDLDVTTITSVELKKLMTSDILYYTISGYLVDHKSTLISGFNLVIPVTVLESEKLINKDDLANLFDNVIPLIPKNDEKLDTNELISYILDNKDSCLNNDIIAATMAHALVANEDIQTNLGEMIIIPTEYKNDALEIAKLEYFYTKDNRWYNELFALFNSIEILLGDSDISNLADEIVNNVLNLNGYVDESKTQTKLEIVYESKILLLSIGNKLNDAIIDNNLISEDDDKTNRVISSCQDINGYYKFSELEAIIDSFTILNIKTNENNEIEVDNDSLVDQVTQEILDYNKPCTKIERFNDLPDSKKPTTLNVIYGSGVIRGIVSDKLFDILSNEDCLNMKEEDNRYLVDDYDAYYEKEVSSLIVLLNDLGITSEDLSSATSNDVESDFGKKITENIFDLKNKLNELYANNTYITGVIFYKELSNNGFTIPNSAYIKISGNKTNVLSKEEAYELLNVMESLGIDFASESYSFTDLDFDKTPIEKIYASAVVKYYISEQLESTLKKENLFDIKVLNSHDEVIKDSNPLDDNIECASGWIKASEIQGLLDFTRKSLGIDISDDLSDKNTSFYINRLTGTTVENVENRERIKENLIGRSILTNKLMEYINSLDNNFLVHSDGAYTYFEEEKYRIDVYSYDEIDSLLSLISTNIESFNASSVDLNSIKALISADSDDSSIKSYLLNASITKKFNENSNPIIIPTDAYDKSNSVIKPLCMKQFLDALDCIIPEEDKGKIELTSFNSFTIPDSSKFDTIAQSIIIRATITQNIEVDQDIALICNKDYVVKTTALSNKKDGTGNIAVFNEEEIKNIMYSIKTVTAGNAGFKITIEDVLNNATSEVVKSNFVCAILTNYFVKKGVTIHTIEMVCSITINEYDILNIKTLKDDETGFIIDSRNMLNVITTFSGI